MQVSEQNTVKIYNLSAGKSLPEWLSSKKKKSLIKKNADIRKRICLIEHFDMPDISNTIRLTNDGNYILATGIYKPRIKCFDVHNMSLKFERCYDAEAVTFEILSDDYSKFVLLQNDRFLEFHSAAGRHYRLRIPRYGRDMKHHYPSADLLIVGTSPDIYRLNLEKGQFMTPFTSNTASEIYKIAVNPIHNLIVCGTKEGRVEAWDYRCKSIIGTLDCALNCIEEDKRLSEIPSVTALKFNDHMELGIGTATGHTLIYDIRSKKPLFVKDHGTHLPIKDLYFHYKNNLIFSMDESLIKIWNKNNGKHFTTIYANAKNNNLSVVPNSGLFFVANESTRIQTFFVPSLGSAPKWASYLDALTEELEESPMENIYDDYKFVTPDELKKLGLDHLIGTNVLRAHMHGYFIDIQLYKKAKSACNPFEYEEFQKKKAQEALQKDSESVIPELHNLPQVNKKLALKLMCTTEQKKRKKLEGLNCLEDDRFKIMFEDDEFEIDDMCDLVRLLDPSSKNNKKQIPVPVVQQVYDSDDSVDNTMGDLLEESEDEENIITGFGGNREITFSTNKKPKWTLDEKNKKHREERKKLVRKTSGFKFKRTPYDRKNY